MGSEVPVARERKRHGRHYTPPALARFLARRLLAHAPDSGVLRVLDPACGDGELLLALHCEAAARRPELRLELTGYDLDAAAMSSARARADAAAVEIDWHTGDFLTASADLADASYDAVITNPPYVRTQQLGGATAQLLSKQFGLRGRIDLTHPFVAIVPRLLSTDGVLGLLCANRFLTTRAGANIRALLSAELSPVELYDLGDTKLFTAAVLPAVTIATRCTQDAPCRYASAYEIDRDDPHSATDLFDALIGGHGTHVTHNGRTFAIEIGTLVTGATKPSGHRADPQPTYATRTDAERSQMVVDTPSAGHDLTTLGERRFATSDVDCAPLVGDHSTAPGELRSAAMDVDRAAVSATSAAMYFDSAGGSRVGAVGDGGAARAGEQRYVGAAAGCSEAWRMSRPGVDAWLADIGAATWRVFGDVGRIRVGIKTTADKVFISDRWAEVEPCPEAELLLELITHHDLGPWRVRRACDRRVLYPYDTARPARTPVDLVEFPCAADYLRVHKDVLAARGYVTAGGREWFEIWVPQRPHLWRVPKVVFPDISERPRFALDRSGAVVNGDCYWISLADLRAAGDGERLAYLLMGVANSALGLAFYDAVCGNRLYSGRRRWITQYVSRLPLPDPHTRAAAGIIDLVRDFVDGGRPHDADGRHLLDERVAAAFGVVLEPSAPR
ncbi:Eco57I restriction-modification methylase domain-containing protein [Nocardia sp. NPDC052566]|uniref:Eco57I restriction-modification methylase domain-containing protein n=1 Tax=Nocardia sp. NPDC052566 TaxID=3364330 RepID=UPI0037C6682A